MRKHLIPLLLLAACGGGGPEQGPRVLTTHRAAVLFDTADFGLLYWPAYTVYDPEAQPGSQDAYVIDERGVRHENAIEIEGWYTDLETDFLPDPRRARFVPFDEQFTNIPGPVAMENADGVFDLGDGRVKPTDVWLAQLYIP